MKKFLRKTEIFTDRAIPYLLIILLVVITIEIFFIDIAHNYSKIISSIDSFIIFIFAVDLCFKYLRSKNIPYFLKRYWLEIIALFPAFLVIRIFEEFIAITRLENIVTVSQEALELTEKAGIRANRIHYFARFVKPLARVPRFFKAFVFYEKPGKWF